MPRPRSLLVVDDDAGVVDWLVEELRDRGFSASGTTDPKDALARVSERSYDVVVSDVEMPGLRGLDLLDAIHARRPSQLVVLMTAFGSIELAMQCIRAGAADFLAKPFAIEALVHALDRTLRERTMRREIVRLRGTLAASAPRSLVATSAAMRRVVEIARRVAATGSTVLLTGESGVGKSALARFIHDASERAKGRFVSINCASLPAGLVESELFGAKRGAFTDAREDRDGVFVQADQGTLFLDEVVELPLETQPKLLLALESGAIRPLGGSHERRVSARILAATNRSPEQALRDKTLRADLYHRLNVIRLEIPPLRDRPEDVPALVDQLLHTLAPRVGRQVVGVTDEAMRWLRTQPWPGNVRELANVLERALAMTDHDVLVLDDFVPHASSPRPDEGWLGDIADDRADLESMERRYVRLVLDRCGGNKAQAARVLGVDRTTLYRKLGAMAERDDREDEG